MLGVLPGTGETAVVKENVALREYAGLAVLFVLLDGVTGFGGGDFELAAGVLGAVCGGEGGREGWREGGMSERDTHIQERKRAEKRMHLQVFLVVLLRFYY